MIDDVLEALPDHMWVQKDFWSLDFHGALRTGWEGFVDVVKHRTRYLFTAPSIPERAGGHNEKDEPLDVQDIGYSGNWEDEAFGIPYDREGGIPAAEAEMLDATGAIIRQLGIFRTLDQGSVLFRARVHSADENLTTAAQLGPPDQDHAMRPNRMSPAGIVMFYGAIERETAIAETFQGDRPGAESKVITVAQFEVLRPLVLVDLTELPAPPCIFEPGNHDRRQGIYFLHGFVDDLVKPIARDGREHIDYVPTQIVTEYFRYRLQTKNNKSIDGVIYSSPRKERGSACVLFLDQSHCGVQVGFGKTETVLSLRAGEIERIDARTLLR